MKLLQLIRQAYPLDFDWKGSLRFALALCVGVSFMVYNFGVPSSVPFFERAGWSLLYGGISLTVFLGNVTMARILFIPRMEDRWLLWHEWVWGMWNFLSIGTANWVAGLLLFNNQPSWQGFLETQYITLVIGLIPITLFVLWSRNRKLKKRLAEAGQLEARVQELQGETAPGGSSVKMVQLHGQNQAEVLTVPLQQLCYVESEKNYLGLYLLKEGQLQKETLRNTMANAEAALGEHPEFMRVHRAFIVNTSHIHHVQGNARGYQLSLQHVPAPLPVSRSYIPAFRQRMGISG